jgi:hypothetical protein
MIYSVVPEDLARELYDRLADYYKDDANVMVIVDRRRRDRRRRDRRARTAAGPESGAERRRERRDRRRPRVAGEFPPVDAG